MGIFKQRRRKTETVASHLHQEFFDETKYLMEFTHFIEAVNVTDRNPLNTEMFFLWSMIRSTKPELFIESGTFRGYSANFICEALSRNANNPNFFTIGHNLDDCLTFATKRLSKYHFANVINGDSREIIKQFQNKFHRTAFFIDGPKGRNLPPLLFNIIKMFSNIEFISVHDCEKESGSNNRWYIENFFGNEYPIIYCSTPFQEKFAFLDEVLIGKSKLIDWHPHYKNGKWCASYGTETGYILPKMKIPTSRSYSILHKIYLHIRFKWYLGLSNFIHRIRCNLYDYH